LDREVDLRGPAARADDPVFQHAGDDLERVLERPLDLLRHVLGPAADEDRDRARVLAAGDERHVLLPDLLLLDVLGAAEVRGAALLEAGDDLAAGRPGQLLQIALLDLLDRKDAFLREVVQDDVVDPLLADHDVRPGGLDLLGYLEERFVLLVDEALDLGRVLDVDLALDFGLLDLKGRVQEGDLGALDGAGHPRVAALLVEEDPLDQAGVEDRAAVLLLDLDLIDIGDDPVAALLGDLLDRVHGDCRELLTGAEDALGAHRGRRDVVEQRVVGGRDLGPDLLLEEPLRLLNGDLEPARDDRRVDVLFE